MFQNLQVLDASIALAKNAGRRQAASAQNLANADTPGYKARDIDFGSALAHAQGVQKGMVQTHANHMSTGGLSGAAATGYRVPAQPSLDGNTVETDREHAAFMDNAIRYQASLNFLEGRIQGILRAIKGE